jgi:hypothetical protein
MNRKEVKEFVETLHFHGYIDHDITKLDNLIDDYYPKQCDKADVRRSLLYKNEEEVKHSVDIKTYPDGKLKLLFSADCGKFGTDEPLDEYELTVKELLLILQKHDAGAYR